jgi:hypothetical protein
VSSSSTSCELGPDAGDKEVAALEVAHKCGELAHLHLIVAQVDVISDTSELVRDEVLLRDEVVLLLLEVTVAVYLYEGTWIVESLHLFS